MPDEIRWTEESEEHVGRYGVDPAEVEEVAYTRPAWLPQDGKAPGSFWARPRRDVIFSLSLLRPLMTDKERRLFRRKAR